MKTAARILVVLAVFGALLGTATAGATILKDLPLGGLIPANDCTGEDLLLSGVGHIVINDSGIHFKVSDVQAVGMDTGAIWTGTGVSVQNQSSTTGENGASTTRYVFRIRLRSGDTRYWVRGTGHTTVNANGDVTSDFLFEDEGCN